MFLRVTAADLTGTTPAGRLAVPGHHEHMSPVEAG
jgi:hypothetical protein